MSAAEIGPEQDRYQVDIGSVALMLGGVVARGSFSSRDDVQAAVEKALDLTEELVQVFDSEFTFEQRDYQQLQDVLIQRYQRATGVILSDFKECNERPRKQYRVPI